MFIAFVNASVGKGSSFSQVLNNFFISEVLEVRHCRRIRTHLFLMKNGTLGITGLMIDDSYHIKRKTDKSPGCHF